MSQYCSILDYMTIFGLSKLLDAGEVLRFFYSLYNSHSVFDMRRIIFNSGIEDIWKTMLPHKDIGQYSDAL
jgi:hypothetical protein